MLLPRLLSIFFLAGLTACSSSVVHIYTRGMEQNEVARLQGLIEAQGFKTRLNPLGVPAQITSPTMIYSPFRKDLADIYLLDELLRDAGYDVELVQESLGNHHYTRENVGFYPLAFGDIRKALADSAAPDAGAEEDDGFGLVGKEFTAQCEDDALDGYLLLQERNRFSLEFESWDEEKGTVSVRSRSGNWGINGQMVQLRSGAEAAPFVLERGEETLPLVRLSGRTEKTLETIKLFNVLKGSGVFNGCDFFHVGSVPVSPKPADG